MCAWRRHGRSAHRLTFAAIASAILYTVFLWWFSTGAILWLDRLPRRTFRWSLALASVLALAAIYGLVVSRADASPAGAICAFTCALGVWGWHETSFLMGLVTGPSTARCPPGARGWRRFRLAAATLIYHEAALALTAAAIAMLTWHAPNPVGGWTFAVLFAARLSAKLNIFLGVPNFTESFFPDHLRYLTSYLRKSPTNALFPLSISAGVALAGVQAWAAFDPLATPFAVTAGSLLFTLTALALLEHAFMVLPLPDAALWRWAMPKSPKTSS
jgi:putative photosynthetic complex assembly protein 2